MIILIKNENKIGYKITPERVGIEKGIELELEKFGRVGLMGVRRGWDWKNFLIFLNF